MKEFENWRLEEQEEFGKRHYSKESKILQEQKKLIEKFETFCNEISIWSSVVCILYLSPS